MTSLSLSLPLSLSSRFEDLLWFLLLPANVADVTDSTQDDPCHQATPTCHTSSEQWSSLSVAEGLSVASGADNTSSLSFIEIVSKRKISKRRQKILAFILQLLNTIPWKFSLDKATKKISICAKFLKIIFFLVKISTYMLYTLTLVFFLSCNYTCMMYPLSPPSVPTVFFS